MISIVDDDAAVRDSLRFLLECEGYETREFASAREFLPADRAADGDCLILDVHMPGMSGIELLETMRRQGDTRPSSSSAASLMPSCGSGPTPPERSRSSTSHITLKRFSNSCVQSRVEVNERRQLRRQ